MKALHCRTLSEGEKKKRSETRLYLQVAALMTADSKCRYSDIIDAAAGIIATANDLLNMDDGDKP